MPDLLDLLTPRWSEVEATWPGLSVQPDEVAAHLAAQGHDAESLATAHLPDLVLAFACSRGDEVALRGFEESVLRGAETAIRSIDANGAFIDEVKQRLRLKLLLAEPDRPARVLDYAGKGRIAAWVTVAAVRTALTFVRETQRANKFSEDRWAHALALPDTGDTEVEYLKQRYREEFAESLRLAVERLDERARAVMRLHFAQGLNIDKIGKIYGVHRATVARWIAKSRDDLQRLTAEILQTQMAVPASELSSLDRLVRSQLDISLGGLLG